MTPVQDLITKLGELKAGRAALENDNSAVADAEAALNAAKDKRSQTIEAQNTLQTEASALWAAVVESAPDGTSGFPA